MKKFVLLAVLFINAAAVAPTAFAMTCITENGVRVCYPVPPREIGSPAEVLPIPNDSWPRIVSACVKGNKKCTSNGGTPD
jgi:hypothetical protein